MPLLLLKRIQDGRWGLIGPKGNTIFAARSSMQETEADRWASTVIYGMGGWIYTKDEARFNDENRLLLQPAEKT